EQNHQQHVRLLDSECDMFELFARFEIGRKRSGSKLRVWTGHGNNSLVVLNTSVMGMRTVSYATVAIKRTLFDELLAMFGRGEIFRAGPPSSRHDPRQNSLESGRRNYARGHFWHSARDRSGCGGRCMRSC